MDFCVEDFIRNRPLDRIIFPWNSYSLAYDYDINITILNYVKKL